jgi:hypothetical protein
MSLLLLIIQLVVVFAALPNRGYRNCAYGPSWVEGLILLTLVILLLAGRLNL